MSLQIRRIYDPPEQSDGVRILIDRLWPRGVSKARAALDDWNKDLAPSSELRTWWKHDPARMDEFAQRYRDELSSSPAAQRALTQVLEFLQAGKTVTLLYAAKDRHVNHARVLQEYLEHAAQQAPRTE